MNDDVNLQPQNTSADSDVEIEAPTPQADESADSAASAAPNPADDADDDLPPGSNQIFDISEDSISPISPLEDTAPPAAPVKTPASVPASAASSVNPAASPVLKRSQPGNTPAIPLQDFSASLAKAQNTSSHPKIPAPAIETASLRADAPQNSLQKEITSILPPKLRPQKKPPASAAPAPIAAPAAAPGSPASIKTPAKPAASPVPEPLANGTQPVSPLSFRTAIPQDPNLKPLRTYETDVADLLAQKKASAASMVIAEDKRQQETGDSDKSTKDAHAGTAGKKLLLILLSVIFIGGGAIGAYYLYMLSPLAPVAHIEEQPQVAAGLVPADDQQIISIDGLDPFEIRDVIAAEFAKPQNNGTIREIIPAHSEAGQLKRVTGPEMLDIMEIDAPDMLVRSLTPSWMLGIYADTQGNKSIFIVATTNFFQNSFAGFLQWESVMADDLKQYLYPTPPQGIYTAPAASQPVAAMAASTTRASTTASTTAPDTLPASTTTAPVEPVFQPSFTLRGTFVDRIVKNKDVRVFQTDNNASLFMYSFIDSNRIVFTTSTETLAEILDRLEKQAFIR